ncbi:11999_t:CDS:2 [Entrophospora sp. SA101]|nr:12699_t:CDS:2 [Entrophospora sp. SA101]CAJ0765775.1 11999_t:CDS:2 [Entrophospora sp. SA101]CAJ0907788.1 950_t:CDS:2 [Entrophospora sp. SA101]
MSSKVVSPFMKDVPPFNLYYTDKLNKLCPSIQWNIWKSLTTGKYPIRTVESKLQDITTLTNIPLPPVCNQEKNNKC